jgi:uncharacterized membrane protein
MYSNYSRPTTLGIDERWERVLCYAFIWISGLIMLFVERRNEVVRRHAKQSILVFGTLSVLGWIVGFLGSLLGHIILVGWLFSGGFWLIGALITLVSIVAWIALMLMAYASPKTLFVGPRYDRML